MDVRVLNVFVLLLSRLKSRTDLRRISSRFPAISLLGHRLVVVILSIFIEVSNKNFEITLGLQHGLGIDN